jgi:hypothetical protein
MSSSGRSRRFRRGASRPVLWVAGALLALPSGCGQPAPRSEGSAQAETSDAPSRSAAQSRPGPTTRPGAFRREQLIADARQLAEILESTHPDPYINGGGRIAFHRRLHRVLNAIPEEGMTRDEFYRLLRPFVAGVGDAHTNFTGGYEVNARRPGGLPLRLAVVEQSLYVTGVTESAQRGLVGARLVSVEGVPLAELLERQRRLRGVDNIYHALQLLAEQSLWHQPYMRDLIPEWRDDGRVRVELRRPDGRAESLVLPQPTEVFWVGARSKVTLPVPDRSGFLYAFLREPDSASELAYVRFTHMGGYREARELRQPILTQLARPPSATDTFRKLVVEMKKRRTETLVLDVRGNHGGNSMIVDILIYYLYGKDTLLKMAGLGTGESGAFRYSRLYFADRPAESLAAVNADRVVPLVEGDYDFSWSFVGGQPIARRTGPAGDPPFIRFLRASPTFRPEFDSGAYAGYHRPRQVLVLCDAGTLSAGFSVVGEFHHLGATLVGTPSAQAPNSFGSGTFWRLNHTGLEGMVPMIAAIHFRDDPEKAHVLPMDRPLTYERLAAYGFDPNAEYLYALERR